MPEPLLISHPETGGLYYVGELDPAKRLVAQDRIVFTGTQLQPGGVYHWVHLNDSEDPDDTAEWGRGETAEEAWRYALGAAFGPVDDEYDEARLREALRLQEVAASLPDPRDPTAVTRFLLEP